MRSKPLILLNIFKWKKDVFIKFWSSREDHNNSSTKRCEFTIRSRYERREADFTYGLPLTVHKLSGCEIFFTEMTKDYVNEIVNHSLSIALSILEETFEYEYLDGDLVGSVELICQKSAIHSHSEKTKVHARGRLLNFSNSPDTTMISSASDICRCRRRLFCFLLLVRKE